MNPTSTLLVSLSLAATAAAQTIVFSNDFDSSIPADIDPGVAAIEGVQGYAGYGPVGDVFGGTFLRSPTGNRVTLSLSGLPAHYAISLDFLFAAIDSLDGTGTYPSGDFFRVTLDGATLFRESFANASSTQFQSYVAPLGVTLARRIDLGFSGPGSYYTDSAYDLGADPIFANLAHTGATATFTFEIEGPGIQGLGDESWAMDNLRVTVATVPSGSFAAYGASCGPVLSGGAAPGIGRPMSLAMDSLPSTTVVANCALGMSSTSFGALTLPLPLDFLGMTGCWLLQDMGLTGDVPMALSGTSASVSILVPNDPRLLGGQLYAQGWAFAPGANPARLVFSGGLRVFLGQ